MSFGWERFNKDLEEIKKSQYIMHNAINEIKNTLEATNSIITEAEDRISEVEDRMVEINIRAEKRKTYNTDHYTQQGSYSNMKEKSKALQASNN